MAVANVIRVSIKGTMPGGELWSINPVFQIGGVSTAEDITTDQANAIALAVDAVTVPTDLRLALATSCAFTGIRVEARRWNGDLAAIGEHVKTTPVVGTGTSQHPYQTSIVLSLRTAGVGGSGRGRAYIPATGLLIATTNLRPSSTAVSTILAAVKSYLSSVAAAVNTVTTNDVVLSVWSRLNESTQPVVALQMGDILDTQRRRRDGTVETYSSTTYP
jgi:hypothetical protein